MDTKTLLGTFRKIRINVSPKNGANQDRLSEVFEIQKIDCLLSPMPVVFAITNELVTPDQLTIGKDQ